MDERTRNAAIGLLETVQQFKRVNWGNSPIAGIKTSELFILFTMDAMERKNGAVRVSDISKALDVAVPTVTQLLKGLEQRGYVEKRIDGNDKRVVLVAITPETRKVIETALGIMLESFAGLVTHLGVEDSETLVRLLNKSLDHFSAQVGKCRGKGCETIMEV